MITIRSSKAGSKVTLICVDVVLKTARNIYTISSDRLSTDSRSSFGDGLFGGISWPVSRFRMTEGFLLEQQMFLPHDESTVAMSWAIRGDTATPAQLIVRPFFSGCGPRSYRDVGFHLDSEDNGGRLTWLPHVRGPKLFADTNGRYEDEAIWSPGCFFEEAPPSASAGDLITPGRFEFELGRRPAVLILSEGNRTTTRHHQDVGIFLAGLMQENAPTPANPAAREHTGLTIQQPAIT